jgi:hypothetical protein
MSDKAQLRLLTVLSILVFEALNTPLKKLLSEHVPERRGARDDVAEAVLQAAARLAAVMIASGLVRQLARRRG